MEMLRWNMFMVFILGPLKPDYAIKHRIGFPQTGWKSLCRFPNKWLSQGYTRSFSILSGIGVSTEFCCGLRRTDSELGFCIGAEIPTSMMGVVKMIRMEMKVLSCSFRQDSPAIKCHNLSNTPLCLTNQPVFQVQILQVQRPYPDMFHWAVEQNHPKPHN